MENGILSFKMVIYAVRVRVVRVELSNIKAKFSRKHILSVFL